jgi:uncharacterized protein YchJ
MLDVSKYANTGQWVFVRVYYKVNGRMHKMHEVSQFIRDNSRWFYWQGIIK